MSRTTPWRNKPTTLITQMIPVASQMKLYLVNQIGPTSFVFKDENQNKFKVNIGLKVSCSCGIVQNDHCIHTLYVLLKKYRVPDTHPILWQASYIDSELQGLIQLKYMEKKKQPVSSNFKPKKKKQENDAQTTQDFPPLDEDQSCPICYQDMQNQCYSSCSTCHKFMHTKCLKVWVRHKEDHGQSVTCPMCRSEFHNPMGMVMGDLDKWEKRFTTHKGTVCKTCGVKNIKGLIYKCLMCPSTDLCKYCFEGNQHLEHDRFFVRQMSNQNWKIAQIRTKKSRKELFQLIKQTQTHSLAQNPNTPQFILSLFPTIKQHQSSQSINQLGIVGNEMLMKQICYKCRQIGDETMKRLNCGHTVHTTCLREMIVNEDYICEIDGECMCPGYLNAIGVKVRRSKKGGMADVAFFRLGEEAGRIKEKFGEKLGEKLGENIGFGVGVKMERLNERTKEQSTSKFNAKSKDKNFRILKKNIIQKRAQLQQLGQLGIGGISIGSPIMITGMNSLQHQSNLHPAPLSQINKPPSSGIRNRSVQRPY